MSVNNSTKIALSLMVEPCVGKYLAARYQLPYAINAQSLLGAWLINALSRKSTPQVIDFESDFYKESLSKHTFEFQFYLPSRYLVRTGTFIPATNAYHFNQFVLKLLYAELMIDILYQHKIANTLGIQQVIENFRAKYGILEKELPDERLRKKYLRLRKSHVKDFRPGDLLMKI